MELIILQLIIAFIAIKLDGGQDTVLLGAIYLIPFIGLILASLMIIIELVAITQQTARGNK